MRLTPTRRPDPAASLLAALLLLAPAHLLAPAGPLAARTPQARPQVTTVPSVVGRPEDEAEELLARARIGPVTKRDTVLSGVAPGTVVRQIPIPRTQVRLPVTATLWVARPARLLDPGSELRVPGGMLRPADPALTTVPDVRGRALQEAVEILAGAGVQASPERVASAAPPGIVVGQLPEAGSTVRPGTPGRLFVSGGPPATNASPPAATPTLVRVPGVVGRLVQEAVGILGQAGLKVEGVERIPTGEAREGTVLRQLPQEGTTVTPGAPARLWIAVAAPAPPTVPDVTGRTVDDARKILAGVRVQVGGVREVPTDARRPGTVVAQSPTAGTPVAPGTVGTLAVAVPLPRVPAVVGMAVDPAARRLADAGIAVRVEPRESDRPPGTVVEQLPAAGTVVEQGARGVLWVATAPTVTVPPLRGRDLADAAAILGGARLLSGAVARVPSDEDAGTVLGQRPPAGERVPLGTAVALQVSSGPPEPNPELVVVPPVTGGSVDGAREVLERSILALEVVDSVAGDAPRGTVTAQSPSPGTRVDPGTLVGVRVSRGPEAASPGADAPPGGEVVPPGAPGTGPEEPGAEPPAGGPEPPATPPEDESPAAPPQEPPAASSQAVPATVPPRGPRPLGRWAAGAAPVVLLSLFLLLRLRRARGKRSAGAADTPSLRESPPPASAATYRAPACEPRGTVECDGPLLPAVEVGLRARDGTVEVALEMASGGPLIRGSRGP